MRSLTLTGFMGTGKTAAGRIVATRLGMPFADLDAEIELRTGCSIAEIFARDGEPGFREVETRVLRDVLSPPGRVVATGGGALLQADNLAAALAAGLVVCLQASADALAARTESGGERPLLDGAPDRATRIRELLAARAPAYAAIPAQIDTTDRTVEQVADEVIALWQNHLPEA